MTFSFQEDKGNMPASNDHLQFLTTPTLALIIKSWFTSISMGLLTNFRQIMINIPVLLKIICLFHPLEMIIENHVHICICIYCVWIKAANSSDSLITVESVSLLSYKTFNKLMKIANHLENCRLFRPILGAETTA